MLKKVARVLDFLSHFPCGIWRWAGIRVLTGKSVCPKVSVRHLDMVKCSVWKTKEGIEVTISLSLLGASLFLARVDSRAPTAIHLILQSKLLVVKLDMEDSEWLWMVRIRSTLMNFRVTFLQNVLWAALYQINKKTFPWLQSCTSSVCFVTFTTFVYKLNLGVRYFRFFL